MSEDALLFIYTTVGDMDAAERIATALVEPGLAACVNIYPGMRSVYRWQGKVEIDEEVSLFIKVPAALSARAMEEVRRLHPYDVPALLEIPLGRVDGDYLAWAKEQTREQRY
ncbi:CutA1 divalent ion tolerance protein [Tepidicaulis marinus]|uniref:CutA1 divalent ion tolerance protein n=1 Tax=Tepidicaulis marinus TaxID=1333998 RepID=A0A081BD85_9HYPH|nr:divalent-cation tolerance protein CutA [Tepidicaulis marinus]GAK46003.1 CutA1 divalent ion tolerance protein [Tepidicaulis marinus]